MGKKISQPLPPDRKWSVQFTGRRGGADRHAVFTDVTNHDPGTPLNLNTLAVAYPGQSVSITSVMYDFVAQWHRSSDATIAEQIGNPNARNNDQNDMDFGWTELNPFTDPNNNQFIQFQLSGAHQTKAYLRLKYSPQVSANRKNNKGGKFQTLRIPPDEMIMRITIQVS